MTRKFTFLLMALLALAGFKSWGQNTLTVCDGTDFHNQVPIYTGYFDEVGTTSQFIIPSTEIVGLQGGSITKLEFYIAGSPYFSSFDYAELKCSLKEVDSEVINGIVTSGLSTVYEGLLTYTATTMSVTFTTPFLYTGGHLLVSFEVTSKSSYNECYFYGTNTSYVSSYCNEWENTPISFIPKTTFTYTPSTTRRLTVNDGTSTNEYVPFYGYYADQLTKSQYIIPASKLTNMQGGSISVMEFSLNNSTYDHAFLGSWNVYIKEVDYTTMPNSYDESFTDAQKVYTGSLSVAGKKMVLTLDTQYEYGNGNLMVYFEQTSSGGSSDFSHTYWYGENQSYNAAYAGYNSSNGSYTFLPKTTFTYLPGATYTVNLVQPEVGGSISASKTFAVEGETITLTATPAVGYVLDYWTVTDGEGTIEVNDNQFAVRTSDVTVTATFKTLPRYTITVTPNEHGTVSASSVEAPDENGYLENAVITLIAQGNDGWTLAENGYTITPSDPTVTVEIQPGAYGSYYFLMPACDVTISSTFRELEQYTVTYHINGVESQETLLEGEYFNPNQPTLPAGTGWFGWVTEDLGNAYTTTEPENKFTGGQIEDDMDLYAVFKFTETVTLEGFIWERVSSDADLKDGDQIIIVGDQSSFYYYTIGQRPSSDAVLFNACTPGVLDTDIENGNFNANTTIFTVNKIGNLWTFTYEDAFAGITTLARNDYDLVPFTMGGVNEWMISGGYICAEDYTHYIYLNYNNHTFSFDGYSPAFLYKKTSPTQTNYYYMTNVLGYDGTDEHIASNTSATNVVIAKNAKLTIDNGATLNVEGICLSASHDAAQLVIAEGGQLVHHNEGTVATFQKRITAYNDPQGNDGYYLIANPTDNETVANLVNEEGYDLYTFDGAANLEWINMKSSPVVANDGIGYLYANSANVTLSFAGELTPADSINKSLTYAAAGEGIDFPGFNLLGNPYACNVYLDKPAYLLDGGEYQSIAANTAIAPCKGFFVEATAANQSVTISTTAPEAPANALSLTVSQNRGNVIDRAIVSFDGSSNLHKFMMNPAHTNIRLAKQGEEFAALSSDAEGEIPVSFKAEKNGSYTISVNTENVEAQYLHLIDNMTGADVDLLSSPSYTFNASTNDYAYRFKLVFNVTMDDANNGNDGMGSSFAYISNGEIIISNEGRATLQVIDVMGRIVRNEQIEGDARISTEGMTAGVYVLNLNGNVQKIVVR